MQLSFQLILVISLLVHILCSVSGGKIQCFQTELQRDLGNRNTCFSGNSLIQSMIPASQMCGLAALYVLS